MGKSSVRQRRLGSELRQLRKQAGLTGREAAAALDLSESMVSRIEAGRRGVRSPDLNALLDAYRLTDRARRQGLLRLAHDANRQDWFSEYEDVLKKGFRDYLSLESEATSIRHYHPQCLPGLLQTEAYARALLVFGPRDSVDVAKIVKVRMERQSVLDRDQPPQLSVVVDEPVIHRAFGGKAVLRDQLRHLLTLARRPNFEIQVLPHATETGTVITGGAFAILSFPEAGVDAVFLENLVEDTYMETDDAIRTYGVAFDQLRAAALDPESSVERITAAAEELGSHD